MPTRYGETVLAREHSFALVNKRLGLIEATGAWFHMLESARLAQEDPDRYVVRPLVQNLALGELETFKDPTKEKD